MQSGVGNFRHGYCMPALSLSFMLRLSENRGSRDKKRSGLY
jgi:hypothetical protein